MKRTFKELAIEIWRLIYPVLIYFAVAFIVESVALSIYIASKPAGKDFILSGGVLITEEELNAFISQYSLHITAVTNLILIPVFLIFLRGDNRKKEKLEGYRYAMPGVKDFILIIILGMVAAVSVNVLVSLSGLVYLSPKYQEVSEAIYSGSVTMEIISAVIAAPVLEELFFRGMIHKRLRRYCNVVPAILISSAFFGIFHGNLVQFVYAFLIGCMLAYVYEQYKTIWMPVAFHVGANLLSILITEFLPEKAMNVSVVLIAMLVCMAVTVILLRYVSRYRAVAVPVEGSEG